MVETTNIKRHLDDAIKVKSPKLDMLTERYPEKMKMIIDETHADFISPISMIERIPGEPIIFHVLK